MQQGTTVNKTQASSLTEFMVKGKTHKLKEV